MPTKAITGYPKLHRNQRHNPLPNPYLTITDWSAIERRTWRSWVVWAIFNLFGKGSLITIASDDYWTLKQVSHQLWTLNQARTKNSPKTCFLINSEWRHSQASEIPPGLCQVCWILQVLRLQSQALRTLLLLGWDAVEALRIYWISRIEQLMTHHK